MYFLHNNTKTMRDARDLINKIITNDGEEVIPLLILIKEITNVKSVVELVCTNNNTYRITCIKNDGTYANLVYDSLFGFQFSITKTFMCKPSDHVRNNYNQYPLFKMLEHWGFDLS